MVGRGSEWNSISGVVNALNMAYLYKHSICHAIPKLSDVLDTNFNKQQCDERYTTY